MSSEVKVKQEKKKPAKKKEKKAIAETSEKKEEPVVLLPVQESYRVIDEYWVVEPFAKVKIVEIPEAGNQRAYFVEEVQLSEAERKAVNKLIDILSVELEPPASFDVELREHVVAEARRLAEKYRSAVRGLSEESWKKVIYYIERDLVGYGPIEVLMRDYRLEDISCDGVDRAIHVWHRDYESIPTNIVFRSRDYLREFIVKLAHMAGKHISAAFPIVDAMLPGRHRLAATYGEEVSPRGSTFTIRKFREKPLSIVEIISSGNLDSWSAAYLWLMIENRMTAMVIGATAAGKTTLLNAIANFFKPGFKIVTIEETPELNLPHENWVQLVSRESYGLGESKVGEITLYDLVKVSLRYRPDYIIVGEVRGEEAFVLFQAMSTGHGGMSTMHADSLDRAVKRLTSPPMNVSPSYIPSLNIALLSERTILPDGKFARRVKHIWEIEDYEKYREIVKWDPVKDVHVVVSESHHIRFIAEKLGKRVEDLYSEIERRRLVLEWMRMKNIKETRDVFTVINKYYVYPEEVYAEARRELEEKGAIPAPVKIRPSVVVEVAPKPVRALPAVQTRVSTHATSEDAKPVPQQPVALQPPVPLSVGLSQESFLVLRTLASLGGEADHESLVSMVNLPREVFSRAISELAGKRLLVPTLLVEGGKPLIGYKITSDGEKTLKTISQQ
ncbi:type II/IV secretion system ATPase subunit [Thermofilum pendens]|uniref:Type II secretion system protein E n=1 Tax=Thermofilum pendens (strain DSM 2475 / Hrk 5) TaxID=368408 RepID=A1RXB8_THEPD|nr:type II/IV secretion system ATPase subunit [Thermofilum pendens]ABL77848.1 type II secretion system protein E [Thermofilum pendens Hrk 5]